MSSPRTSTVPRHGTGSPARNAAAVSSSDTEQIEVSTRFPGRSYSCEMYISQSKLIYGRRVVPLLEIEHLTLDRCDTTCLHVKFWHRSREKLFYFISGAACEETAVRLQSLRELQMEKADVLSPSAPTRELLSELSVPETPPARAGRNETGSTGPPSCFWSPSSMASSISSLAEDDAPSHTPSAADAHAQGEIMMAVARESSRLALRRWCCTYSICRHHVVEAVLFGVCMPLAVLLFWLLDVRRRLRAHKGHWLPAICHIHARVVMHGLVYHQGKFRDARDIAYQKGFVYRFEAAWNTTVALLPSHGSEVHAAASGLRTWEGLAYLSMVEEDAPRCLGRVGQSLEQAYAMCLELNDLSPWAPLIPANSTRSCWISSADTSRVYLNASEPPAFYWDLLFVAFCSAVALSFVAVLLRLHWRACQGALRALGGFTTIARKSSAAEATLV